MVKHLTKNILYKTGMFNSPRPNEYQPLERAETLFSQAIFPSSVGRLPPSVWLSVYLYTVAEILTTQTQIARGAGSVKADQWRSQITILFVALFAAWQVDGKIPDVKAPLSADNTNNAKLQAQTEALLQKRLMEALLAKNPDPSAEELAKVRTAQMDRSLLHHYEAMLDFTVALRILPSHSISPNEVSRGCDSLSRAVQSWARMNCHLLPYHHYSQHFEDQYLRLGPAPGWWAWGYERNNGTLGRTNHNNHKGGELEATMMRKWWKVVFIQDLVSYLAWFSSNTS